MSYVLIGGFLVAGALFWAKLLSRPDLWTGEEEMNEYVRELASGRGVLSFFEHEGSECVRATIDLRAECPRLELARRGKPPVLAKWVNAVSEHPLADAALAERYVCRAPESPRAFEVLGRLKGALLDTRLDVRELKLEKDSIAIVVARASRNDLDDIAALLDALARLVLLEGGVRVHAEDAVRARCGFCHAELAEEALAYATCDACSTPVHELCWAEHGHCPVLGCRGRGRNAPVAGETNPRDRNSST